MAKDRAVIAQRLHWLLASAHRDRRPPWLNRRPLRLRWVRRNGAIFLALSTSGDSEYRLLGGINQEGIWHWIAAPKRHHRRLAAVAFQAKGL
jgi:hypothetical protein